MVDWADFDCVGGALIVEEVIDWASDLFSERFFSALAFLVAAAFLPASERFDEGVCGGGVSHRVECESGEGGVVVGGTLGICSLPPIEIDSVSPFPDDDPPGGGGGVGKLAVVVDDTVALLSSVTPDFILAARGTKHG